MLNTLFESVHYRSFRIVETFDALKVEGQLYDSIVPFSILLLEALKNISPRDCFELIVEANGNNVKLLRCDAADITSFLDELREYEEPGIFNVTLGIRKATVDNSTSIYSVAAFSRYIGESNVDRILSAWLPIFDGHHRFEIFHPTDAFGSKTVIFQCAPLSMVDNIVAADRAEKLELLNENSTIVNQKGNFLPDDFNFSIQSGNPILDDFFAKACALHCLVFIANFSKIDGDKVSYKINGYKSIIANEVDSSELMGNVKTLHKIYDWCYSGGGNSDKVGLVRNILSLHLDANGSIKFDRELWEAVQSNYQIYLKRNIQSYLEIKNKLAEFIVESTSKTYAMADQILDSFKNNVLIILTFILTVVVINGLKDSGEVTVFSNAYLAIVLLLSAVSAAWLAFTRSEVIKRFDTAADTIKRVLKINYGQILMEVEIDDSIDPVVTINRAYLAQQLTRYTRWWIFLLMLFILLFAVCNIIFTQFPKMAKETTAPSTNGDVNRNIAVSTPVSKNGEAPQISGEKLKNSEHSTSNKGNPISPQLENSSKSTPKK